MKSEANILATSYLMAAFFSAEKFLFFCFTSHTSSLTFSRWSMYARSIPNISSVESAKTSALLQTKLIKFTSTLSTKSVLILTVLSDLSCSRLTSSVSPSRLGLGKSVGLPSKFFMDKSLLDSFSAHRLFLSDGGVSTGCLWFKLLRAVR